MTISENTVDAFNQPNNVEWVRSHVRELKNLAPEDVVFFSEEDFYAMVERMLLRADGIELRHQETTLAFCYASLKIGIGFEVNSDYPWAQEIENTPQDKQADYIWRNLHNLYGVPVEKVE